MFVGAVVGTSVGDVVNGTAGELFAGIAAGCDAAGG